MLAAGAWWPYATTRVYDEVETFARASRFGGSVTLERPGVHTLWVEGPCLTCHDNNPSEYRRAATLSLTGPDGRSVPVSAAPPRLYNTARREGRALWVFDARTAGDYRISLNFDTSGDWDNTPPSNFAVGPGVGLSVGIVRPMTAFVLAGTGSAALIIVVTAVRRRRYFGATQ